MAESSSYKDLREQHEKVLVLLESAHQEIKRVLKDLIRFRINSIFRTLSWEKPSLPPKKYPHRGRAKESKKVQENAEPKLKLAPGTFLS